MISIIDARYVVQLPEYGVYQDIDPVTGKPFAHESDAKAWEDAFLKKIEDQKAAEAAAEKEHLANTFTLTVVPAYSETELGKSVQLDSTIRNGLGDVVPFSGAFRVPIENEKGEVVMIKRVEFVNGQASANFAPSRSGYYCISEAGINHRLPEFYLHLAQAVEVVVYE